MRDDARRLYLVTLRWGGNPCRGGGAYELWLSAPKLPAGYKVEHEVTRSSGEDEQF